MTKVIRDFSSLVIAANLVAALILLGRLALAKLVAHYPYLVAYLLIDAVASASGLLIPVRTNLYFYVYLTIQALTILAATGVALELCRLALSAHPALAAFSRKAVGSLVLVSAALAAATAPLGGHDLPPRLLVLERFLTAERIMELTLVLFLLAISLFLMWFPVKVRKNISLYIIGFGAYFFARSFALLMLNMLPLAFAAELSNIMLCVSLACLVVWIWNFRAEGEKVMVVTGHRWNPAAFDRLSRQLNQMNLALTRLGRL